MVHRLLKKWLPLLPRLFCKSKLTRMVKGSGVFRLLSANSRHQTQILARRMNDLTWAAPELQSFDIDNATLMLLWAALALYWCRMKAYGQWQLRPTDKPWRKIKDGKNLNATHPKAQIWCNSFLTQPPWNKSLERDLDAPGLMIAASLHPWCRAGSVWKLHARHPHHCFKWVTMGLTPERRADLVPVKRLAEASFNAIIAFDSDTKARTVKSVRRAALHNKASPESLRCDRTIIWDFGNLERKWWSLKVWIIKTTRR